MNKHPILAVLSSILLVMTSCSGEGIFYQLQNEELIVDNSLPNIKFFDIHNTDTAGSNGYYVTRGVKLWYREKELNSTWKTIPMPSQADAIQSSAMFRGDLYYTIKSGDSASLYKIDNINGQTPDRGNLVFEVTPTSDYVVLYLFGNEDSGQNRLFLNVCHYNNGGDVVDSDLFTATVEADITSSGFSNSCILDLENYPVMDMAFGSNGNTWLIYNRNTGDNYSGGKMFFSTDNFVSDLAEVTDTALNGWFQAAYAITFGTEDLLLLSARLNSTDFRLYSNSDGAGSGSWTSLNTNHFLSCFASVISDDVSGQHIAAGTLKHSTAYANGYMLIDATDRTSLTLKEDNEILADSGNYDSSDLKNSTINSLLFDDNPPDGLPFSIFAAASLNYEGGLWFLNGSSKDWNVE